MNPISKKLYDKFFSDPDWVHVEKVIMDYVSPLMDMDTLDLSKPADEVRAEVMARRLSYQNLTKFLKDSGVVTKLPANNQNTFR